MRSDLRNHEGNKIRTGKMCSQAAHASLSWLTSRLSHSKDRNYHIQLTPQEEEWIKGSFTKVVLQIEGEEALKELHLKAHLAGVYSHIIIDEGRTEFGGIPTMTCLALGPDEAEKIDVLTKDLKLF